MILTLSRRLRDKMKMKKILPVVSMLLLISCVKPEVSPEQREQFETCKKLLLENKAGFIASGKTQAQKDSLATYIKDFEENNLDQLLGKYEIEQEDVVPFLYSVCEKANNAAEPIDVESTLLRTDSMIKVLDSIILEDSLRKIKH